MSKRYLWFIAAAILLAGGLALYLVRPKYLTCQVFYRSDIKISAAGNSLWAQIADTDAERETGLSGRGCIPKERGMLFKFSQPGQYAFWMKNMKFPIDIIWIGPDKKVVTVRADVSPSTYPETFTSDKPAQFVLELAAGEAERLGIKNQTKLDF